MSDPRPVRGAPSGLAPSMRGLAVIGLAVVAGVVGLQALDDASPAQVSNPTTTSSTVVNGSSTTVAGGASSSTTSGSSTTKATSTTAKNTTTTKKKSGSSSTTTTTVPARPASQVAVWVSNGSQQTGAASVMSQKLKGLGYNTVGIANAETRTGTIVQCKAGFEREAQVLATDVGNNAKVEAFPATVPTGAESANCLVVLGK